MSEQSSPHTTQERLHQLTKAIVLLAIFGSLLYVVTVEVLL